MTDEEKTEEYMNKIDLEQFDNYFNSVKLCEQAYLDGMAEGRKEGAKDIEVLTKENEKLKWELNEVIEDNDYYQEENKKLTAQNKDLCESLDIMNNRESELLDEIKELKMHCRAVDEVNAKMMCSVLCNTFRCGKCT